MTEYSKEFYQQAWGKTGYYERFSYGVGYDRVCAVALDPFLNRYRTALEIGSGGGAFTERMAARFRWLTAIDVIPRPEQFAAFPYFTYQELPDQCFRCKGVDDDTQDFVFCYNLFCHLSDEAIRSYISDVHRVLAPLGDFVFMLSWFDKVKYHFSDTAGQFRIGDILPNGHFYQDETTLSRVIIPNQWQIVSSNLIPEHRDLIIHLKKNSGNV